MKRNSPTSSEEDLGIEFHDPYLKLPMVNNVGIARAANREQQELCQGGTITTLEGDNINLPVSFRERPAYDGKRIIIPNDPQGFSNWISRTHGALAFYVIENPFSVHVFYQHFSTSGMETTLLDADNNLEKVVSDHAERLLIDFDESAATDERVLLLGGTDGETLEERFPWYSFYVKITRNNGMIIEDGK